MTFFRVFLRLSACVWLALVLSLAATPAARADTIGLQRASLQADPSGGWNLDARFDFTLNSSLTDAVSKGIPLYFTTEFTLTRPRWYWLDEQAARTSQSIRLSFQPLTREYRVSSGQGLHLSVPSLDQALAVVKHITSWHVINRGDVSPGQTYVAAVKMELDMAQMPKPFQIDAVNNRDWNLSSEWWRFNFNATDSVSNSLTARPPGGLMSNGPGVGMGLGLTGNGVGVSGASAGLTGSTTDDEAGNNAK